MTSFGFPVSDLSRFGDKTVGQAERAAAMKSKTISVAKQSDDRVAGRMVEMRKLLAVLSALVIGGARGERARFDLYRVYRVVSGNEDQLTALRKVAESAEYDFWREPISLRQPIDIMVPPHKFPDFTDLISKLKMEGKILIENVQKLIDAEERRTSNGMDWTSFHGLEDFDAWMNNLTETYKNVKKIVAGVSYERRNITGVEITFGESFATVFIESGAHAREWLSSASTSWVVNEILKSSEDSIWRKFNYIYVPFFNPDGFVYSWTTNRLWKKTRTPYVTDHNLCYGADLNRNWGFHWNGSCCSKDPCSEAYCGPFPFSEEEAKTLSRYLTDNANKKKMAVYLSFHSYGQAILYPWSYGPDPDPLLPTWTKIAKAAADDLAAVNNITFTDGGANFTVYPLSGNSLDWFHGTCNATISFAYQLRDKGPNGFLLPPDHILLSARELFASIQTLLTEYSKLPSNVQMQSSLSINHN